MDSKRVTEEGLAQQHTVIGAVGLDERVVCFGKTGSLTHVLTVRAGGTVTLYFYKNQSSDGTVALINV